MIASTLAPANMETTTCVHRPLPDGAPGYEDDRWLELAVPVEAEIIVKLQVAATAAGVPLAHVVASVLCHATMSFFDHGCPEVLENVLADAREWPV